MWDNRNLEYLIIYISNRKADAVDCYRALLNDISENCGVTNNQIKQWIREERLTFGEDSPIGIDCEGCGTMIKSGRFCAKCKNDLMRGISNATKKEEPVQLDNSRNRGQSARMRFLEK